MQNYLSAIGDSITSGNGQTTPYPSIVTLPGDFFNCNLGVSGQLLSTINTNIGSYFAVGRSNNVAVLWAGTNDLVAGTAPATLITTLLAAVASLKTLGYTNVICPTVIDRTGLNETTRATYNGLLLSNAGSGGYTVVNFDTTPLGVNGNSGNTTYFIDGVHPTQFSVNTIIAPMIQTPLSAISYPISAQTTWKTKQFRSNHNTAQFVITANAAVAPTDVVVACGWWQGAAGAFQSFVDTSGQTWNQLGSFQSAGGFTVGFWYSNPTTTVGPIQLQLNATGFPFANFGLEFGVFSMPDNATSLTVQSNIFTAASTSLSSGSLSVKANDQLCMLGFAANFGYAATPGSGFTMRLNGVDATYLEDKLAASTASVNGTATINSALASASAFLDLGVTIVPPPNFYSVPDCRVAPAGPNASRTVQQTKIYDVQTSSNHAIPPTDSRAAGAPVDSRVAANIPQNSRTPGTYGPGVN